ncbi:hypothetical protein GCM10028801_16480 [Nocardioides maradonensis]
MTTYRELTTQAADQWVAALKSAEDAVAKVSANAKRVADAIPTPNLPSNEAFAKINEPFAKLNEALAERLPRPSEIVEANFEFTTKLLAAQRDLVLRLIEVGTASAASDEAPAAAKPAAAKPAPAKAASKKA